MLSSKDSKLIRIYREIANVNSMINRKINYSLGIFSHNDSTGIQGGVTDERYHLTSAKHTIANAAQQAFLSAHKTKLDYISVTGAVDLDKMPGIDDLTDGYVGVWDDGNNKFIDSLISDDGATSSFDGHIDIAATKYIQMAGDDVIKYWAGNNAIGIGHISGADKAYSYSFGYACGYQQTGTYFSGQGVYCGYRQSGTYFSGQGCTCGLNQTGDNFSGQGSGCGEAQTGDNFSGQGYRCGYEQVGLNFMGQGSYCGFQQIGNYFSGQGVYCGYRQSGIAFSGQGYYIGSYQTGNYFAGQGYDFGRFNTGNYIFGGGYLTLRHNDADYATALGANSFNNFDEDVANEKTFDNTDIDVANDRITIVGHGFGANDTYLNLKFTQGTSTVPGVNTLTYHQFKIISADIVEIITGTITGQGTGTGHKLTPQFVYDNSTAVGYNAEPDAANQVMLGDSNVTEVKTAGGITAHACKLGDGGTTDYVEIKADGEIKLHGTARVTKKLWLPFNALKAPGVKPASFVDHGISGSWQFADATDDTIVFNINVPVDMDITAAPSLFIGWSTNTAVVTESAVWQLEYLYTALAEDTTGPAQETLTVISDAVAQADGLIVAEITGIDLPGGTDICMHCRLKRLGADGNDDLTDTAELHGVYLGYTSDRLGTAT